MYENNCYGKMTRQCCCSFDRQNSRSKRLNIMQTLIFTILALTLIGNTTAVLPFAVAKAEADENVIYLLGQNTGLEGSADPEITSQCFNYYMPLLYQISLNFSVQYELCVTVASQAATKLSASAAQNRATLISETTTNCNAFASCNSESNNLDFLNCYVTAASADINEFFNISTSASNAAISLKSGLQQISDTEKICQNKAQQTYSTQTTKTYKELYACFANGLPTASSSGIAVNT